MGHTPPGSQAHSIQEGARLKLSHGLATFQLLAVAVRVWECRSKKHFLCSLQYLLKKTLTYLLYLFADTEKTLGVTEIRNSTCTWWCHKYMVERLSGVQSCGLSH